MSPTLAHLLIGLLGAAALWIAWRRTAEFADESGDGPDQAISPVDRADPGHLAATRGVMVDASSGRFGADFRLRPLLRRLARDRLRQRHGIDLDHDAGAAQLLLGQPAWEFLRADRPITRDFRARGIPLPELEAIVSAVERL